MPTPRVSQNDELTVWGVGTTRTFRVHWMLHELGQSYFTKRIESRTGETRTEEYGQLNAKQKIPTLTHKTSNGNDFTVTESFAIMRYCRRHFGDLPYDDYQTSDEGQARYDEWLSLILMELDATSLYVVRRHKDLPEIYGAAPAAITSSKDYFTRALTAVANRISADHPIWGSVFSELDILMTITLDWAQVIGIDLPDNVAGYHAHMQSRHAYIEARRHNFRDLQIKTASPRT